MKKLLILLLSLILVQQSNAQMDEASAVNSLKKIKCLAKMTNCKPRQAFYQSHVNYWQCYLDNNLNGKACESVYPTGKMPECPEDDLNFPPNQYTISYLDKCIASMPVVITKKAQSPVIAQQNPKSQSQSAETNEALLNISGLYFIGNDGQNTGNIGKRLEIQEEKINNTDSQIAIFSEGQEVVSIRRRNNARVVSGYWDYVHEDPDPKFDRLRIKRLCEIKMNPNGDGLLITMQKIRLRPQGGLFANVVNIWDLSNKGYSAIDAAQNVKYEIVTEKGTTVFEYLRKEE